jgi:hypothetical protein
MIAPRLSTTWLLLSYWHICTTPLSGIDITVVGRSEYDVVYRRRDVIP